MFSQLAKRSSQNVDSGVRHNKYSDRRSISYPESTGFLVSGRAPAETLGQEGAGGSDELGPGHKRQYWRMKNRGVWPS